MFTAADLLHLQKRRPFVPFRIHTTDGASYDVHHPELLWVFQRRITIGVPANADGLLQDMHFCALLHIARVQELSPTG